MYLENHGRPAAIPIRRVLFLVGGVHVLVGRRLILSRGRVVANGRIRPRRIHVLMPRVPSLVSPILMNRRSTIVGGCDHNLRHRRGTSEQTRHRHNITDPHIEAPVAVDEAGRLSTSATW
jgi:hypothetical protein